MFLKPMPGDVLALANPDVRFAGRVVGEAREARRSARMAEKAHMHADVHHLGPLPAFFVQKIERLAQDREEIFAGVVAPRVRHHSAFGTAGPHKIEWVFGSTIRTTVFGGMLI